MSSCFGSRKPRREDGEHEPLLPRYRDDTSLQRQVHQKLHTYQMLRALSKGFMPSTEQVIANLRTLLAADLLNPENEELSDSGRALAHYVKQWLHQFIDLLQHKNSGDQIQDFIWYLSKARVSVDMEHIAERASKARAKSDTAAAWKSLQTVGSLLLTNSDVRLFVSDLNIVAREVFKDTAFTLSEVSKEAGKRLEPSQEEREALQEPGKDDQARPSQEDLENQAAEVGNVVSESAARVAGEAERSLVSKVQGREKDTMLYRLKQAVVKLRQRPDYSDSVSTLSLLLKRYLTVYSRVVPDTVSAAEEGVDRNSATDRAVKNFYGLIRSFGDQQEWDELETMFKRVMEHGREDPQFDDLVRELGNALQEMMTDPGFFDHAEERFQDLRARTRQLASESTLREDVDGLLAKIQSTLHSVLRDRDVDNLIKTSTTIIKILSPPHAAANRELVTDAINVFIPLLVQMVQYIPIPRLELSTPKLDLLLENLILEPGATVNKSSFLPYKLRIETYNDVEIRKARFRTTSAMQTFVRIKIDGISFKAEEVGYWMRAHSGLLRVADEGIASIRLDERGIDVHLDVEVGRDRLEQVLTLRGVRVHIHKLSWTLRKSKFSFFAWLFKPLIKPLVRRTIEYQMAKAIGEALHFANRELVFARERLRATRIADPDDLRTFFRAVAARLVPPEDPDVQARVGIAQPGKGVFQGVYTPGSVVKLWNEEGDRAPQRIREGEEVDGGWRNAIFDVHASMLT